MPADFTRVASVDDLAEGRMKSVRAGFEQVCLARVEGQFYALEEFCSHAGGALSSGALDGYEVVCPLHGARFDVRTGKQSVGPSMTGQPTYPVRVDDDGVFIGPMSGGPAIGTAFNE